jgi:DNA-binding response OmpR family regulator
MQEKNMRETAGLMSLKSSDRPSILIVDDEAAIRRYLRLALGTPEFSVNEAGDGKTALAAADTVHPDIILLDLGLPDMDGIEVLRRIRQRSNMPVIILSVRGAETQLTPTEFELLHLLVIHAGRVLTHRQILQKIWGAAYVDQPNVLRVTISNLRHKIEKDASRPRYILTDLGVGYRLRTDT